MIRTLVYTTLFPNSEMPNHGIFVKRRLTNLLDKGGVSPRVIAPVPWFPLSGRAFGVYSAFASVPKVEAQERLDVYHPRFLAIPKVGMSVSPLMLAACTRAAMVKANSDQQIDLIDAHYFYPDGVAATLLGYWMNKPVVITARGTDINLIPEYTVPRQWILWAANRADAIICVSEALRARMIELGVPENKTRTLRNGVDLHRFQPVDRDRVRKSWDVSGRTLLSVGHLIERKGHHHAIDALVHLPEYSLIVAGSGPMESTLRRQAECIGVSSRVRFLGSVVPDELVELYNASDALILCSSREGMANVLLEAIACGTPVVATSIWGTPEVISDARAGVLIERRSGSAVAEGVRKLWNSLPNRHDTRKYAERFSWDDTSQGQLEIFRNIVKEKIGRRGISTR